MSFPATCRRAAFVVALLISATVVAGCTMASTPAKAPAGNILGPDGFDNVKIGMTIAEAYESSSPQLTIKSKFSHCAEGINPTMTVGFSVSSFSTDDVFTAKIAIIGVAKGLRFTTPEGIKVGDSLYKAEQLYGPAQSSYSSNVQFPTGKPGVFYLMSSYDKADESGGIGPPYTVDGYKNQTITDIHLIGGTNLCLG